MKKKEKLNLTKAIDGKISTKELIKKGYEVYHQVDCYCKWCGADEDEEHIAQIFKGKKQIYP
jgi:hypothetical protein